MKEKNIKLMKEASVSDLKKLNKCADELASGLKALSTEGGEMMEDIFMELGRHYFFSIMKDNDNLRKACDELIKKKGDK